MQAAPCTNGCLCFVGLKISRRMGRSRKPLGPSSNREENVETQKEAEIAFLAFSNISQYSKVEQELYLNELKEIIKYNQDHHDMTHVAYQSAWCFLIDRLLYDKNVEEVIVNVLHFGREAAREFEELTECIDWKKNDENEKRRRETKEEFIITRWLNEVYDFFDSCILWNEELVVLFSSIVRVYRAAKDNN
ncbi:uncharacterized protein MONOS_17467 [Monocercomonoides exilis]|uniref:uncharacterized protein n=1 Tax=Monocercomonoides exilis TaxID=2049356 RepID=UPI00355A8F8D|nr:hypothetical protein MONOS_17467 [Monocercomonoides exilis]